MEVLFWVGVGIIIYTYVGYAVVLWSFVRIKRLFNRKEVEQYDFNDLPEVSLLVACFNEGDILEEKIKNTLALNYPKDRLKICFVTDGTDDGSEQIVKKYPEIQLFHKDERKGKNAAINRVVPQINSPILVFCDANTFLNEEALVNIVRHYKDEKVGAVAGEKRVAQASDEDTAGAGEGAYWKYESALKRWDSELNSVVGAAGELFSVRNELYEEVPDGIIIEDFYLSVNIAKNGYKVVYEPEAYATETGSESIGEEKKRKVRISAGGLQMVWLFRGLLNIFKHGWLSFQYVSHRMLRWTLAPLGLLAVLISNVYLAYTVGGIYLWILYAQLGFYALAFMGYLTQNLSKTIKIFFIPYYFLFMNYAVYLGFIRLLKGKQSAVWEKAKRAKVTS